jgi:protein tyrosine/serine phosphatase
MKLIRLNVLIAVGALLLCGKASISAASFENLRVMDPLAGLNLAAIQQRSPAEIPAASLAVRVFETGRSMNAAAPLPNFAQVSPTLFRSGQPTQAGIASLKSSGVKTILKLNSDSPAEAGWAAAAGLKFQAMPMGTQSSPSYEEVDAALAFIKDPANQPVLVHCKLGHDRTGAVVGAYRVSVQGWPVDKAASEALSLGYSDPHFQNITTYLQGYLAHAQQAPAAN